MRSGSITLLLALGIAGTAACGSGAGGGTTGSGPPVSNGPYQRPPLDYDSPVVPNPSDFDTPQTDYDPAPDQGEASGTNGTGAASQWCLSFCYDLLACPQVQAQGATSADCDTACANADLETPCPTQFADAFSCLFDRIDVCDLFEEDIDPEAIFGEDDIEACRPALESLDACGGLTTEPPPDDGGGDGCTSPNCGQCTDACEACLCENGDSQGCDVACATN